MFELQTIVYFAQFGALFLADRRGTGIGEMTKLLSSHRFILSTKHKPETIVMKLFRSLSST